MSEFKVGDRAKTCFHTVTILAICDKVAFVRDETGGAWCEHLSDLTRIEPAVPQPKFSVGQKVHIRNGQKEPVEIVEVLPRPVYRIRCPADANGKAWIPGWSYTEDQLVPVPEPCPTCGGSGKADGGI